MLKNILKILIVFVIGTVGGIFAEQILWPYFIERPLFYKYRLEQSPIYVTERKEITIQENTALKQAIEKVEKAVIGIKSETKAGKILQGSGLIVTSDGLIVTLAELLPQGSDFYFFVDGKPASYQILKRDLKENLALVKIEESNLTTTGLADFERIKLGERVFLMANVLPSSKGAAVQKIVNEGIIKSFDENLIQTNIFEQTNIQASPLFDIEGNLVGLTLMGSNGEITAIPIYKIRNFIGF
jgi:S1-C subfamily serine protease